MPRQRDPHSVVTPSVMTPDLQSVADRPITELVRYSAQSHTAYRHGPQQMVTGLQDYLKLPVGFNPRTLQLATEMQRDPRFAGATSQTMIDAVLDRLRTGGYTYTLEPGVFGQHTADEFWFDRKTGFCEHIASSFVLLMRAMGNPGARRHRLPGWFRQPGRRFLDRAPKRCARLGRGLDCCAGPGRRVDPTSAVAPSRIGSLVRLEAPTMR